MHTLSIKVIDGVGSDQKIALLPFFVVIELVDIAAHDDLLCF